MAAPTQVLPPWLTLSTHLVTLPGGSVLTSSTLLELPLTYFGPSIPLGTNGVWTFGGSTSPKSTHTALTTTVTPPSSTSIIPPTFTSTTATPTSSVSPSSASSSPTSSSPTSSLPTSSSPTSSSPTSSSPTSSPTSSSPSSSSIQSTLTTTIFTTPTSTHASSSASSSLNKGALIGIVIGAILGSLLLLLLALLLLRWRRRRENGYYQTPIWTGWEIIDPTPAESQINGNGDRPPGEGSPRGSGEEADSLLRRSGGTTTMADISHGPISVPAAVAIPGAAAGAGVAPGAPASGSNNGTNNSGGSGGGNTESTVVSDYGILIHGSRYTDDPEGSSPTSIPARPSTDMGFIGDSRQIIPPSELLRIERERLEQEQPQQQIQMHDEPSSSRRNTFRAISTVPEHYSPLSPPPRLDPDRLGAPSPPPKASSSAMSADEHEHDDPMVLTARRVRLSQLGPRSQPELRQSDAARAGSSSSGGWGSLGLGGLARLSRLSWFKSLKDNLSDTYTTPRSRHASRPTSLIARPLSDHDIEAGRALLTEELGPPRAMGLTDEGERPRSSVSAKSAVSGNTVYHDAESTVSTPPPIPSLPRAYISGSQTFMVHSRGEFAEPPLYDPEQGPKGDDDDRAPRLVDVLDIPAPPSVSQFSSASSRSVQFPPGLVGLQAPQAWYESSSSDGDNAGITIDVLEDTPPRAGDGWRAMARNATLSHPAEYRSSFGIPQFTHTTHDLTSISEVGSLHSMRSHLSPMSHRSSGSAPASSRHNLTGSNSSRPSAYSGRSLAHSGSISSDDQRRARGAVSPALSAFGPDSHFPTAPPPPPYMPRSVGSREAGPRESTVTTVTGISESTAREATHTNTQGDDIADQATADVELLSMPWATGLD